MKTITLNMYAVPSPPDTYSHLNTVDGVRYALMGFKSPSGIPAKVIIELPEEFDPRAKVLKELQDQQRDLNAKFHMANQEIMDRISKLQALTCEGVAA